MMGGPLQQIVGKVIAGHGVASGRSVGTAANPYPQGSIALQMPYFAALGLDLSDCFLGTVNLSIAPHSWQLLSANHCFEKLTWTHLHPPETFSFVRIQVVRDHQRVQGWLYHPHPETKAAHHQSASVMELILPVIAELTTGDMLALHYPPDRIQINDPV
jgi:hypothetical protein